MKLAAGTYRYWCDGALQDIVEPWELQRIRGSLVLSGHRVVEGRRLLQVSADYDGAHCVGLRAEWQGAISRSVHYRLRDKALNWREAQAAAENCLALPAPSLMFPLLRAASGPLLRQFAGGRSTVVLPDLRNPAADEFLHPLLSPRRVESHGTHYRYYGGEYGRRGADYWLDSRGLMWRYRWRSAQGKWEVRLEDLEAREDFDWK